MKKIILVALLSTIGMSVNAQSIKKYIPQWNASCQVYIEEFAIKITKINEKKGTATYYYFKNQEKRQLNKSYTEHFVNVVVGGEYIFILYNTFATSSPNKLTREPNIRVITLAEFQEINKDRLNK